MLEVFVFIALLPFFIIGLKIAFPIIILIIAGIIYPVVWFIVKIEEICLRIKKCFIHHY